MKFSGWKAFAVSVTVVFSVATLNRGANAADLSWTPVNVPSRSWSGVVYGDGKFVAVSTDGYTMLSADNGETWTEHVAARSTDWVDIAYGAGKFVAVTNNADSPSTAGIMYSSDGVTWSTVTLPEVNQFSAVAYGSGTFVATAYTGSNDTYTSTDGVTWTPHVSGKAGLSGFAAVNYLNGQFVGVGTDSVWLSADGATWTTGYVGGGYDNILSCVGYGNGTYVSLGDWGTNQLHSSTDGTTWAHAPSDGSSWYSVIYEGGTFVAVAYSGSKNLATSTNGTDWTLTSFSADTGWNDLVAGNGYIIAVSWSATNRVMRTPSPAGATTTSSSVTTTSTATTVNTTATNNSGSSTSVETLADTGSSGLLAMAVALFAVAIGSMLRARRRAL